MTKTKLYLGIAFITFGLLFITTVVVSALFSSGNEDEYIKYYIVSGLGLVLTFLGYLLLSGQRITQLTLKGFGGVRIESTASVLKTPKRELEPEVLHLRQNISSQKTELPGQSAPEFHVLEEKLAFEVTPCSNPMTPMYMLDNNYRIIEWNDAFSACFDRTMEGRRGLNVLEWTYFLDNYEEVLDHGIKAFSDAENLPIIDIEPIHYKSRTYGVIEGIKRAYQIPDDDGSCKGWLITIDPEFKDQKNAQKFQSDLFTSLRLGLMWSEYALSYDIVLNQTEIYPNLIKTIIGEIDFGPAPIADNTKVLDLGAGTGNITALLAKPENNRLVVAVDNNNMMLTVLRRKCKAFLRQDAQGSGVISIKQDITSLFGLKDKFFDVAVVNNVLYSLEINTVEQCLNEVYRVLRNGGEIRISEPHKNADASKVITQIKNDLQNNKRFKEVETHFQKVKDINEASLSQILNKWDIDDMELMLKNIGFSRITYKKDKVYAQQSFIICAKK